MEVRWNHIVFDCVEEPSDLGCDLCGTATGDPNQPFYSVGCRELDGATSTAIEAIFKESTKDLCESWICGDCRDAVEAKMRTWSLKRSN